MRAHVFSHEMDKDKAFLFCQLTVTARNSRSCHTLLVGCELVHPLRIPEAVPLKRKRPTDYDPVIPFLSINSREMLPRPYKEVPVKSTDYSIGL